MRITIKYDYDASNERFVASTVLRNNYICAAATTPEAAKSELIRRITQADAVLVPGPEEVEI